MAVNVSTETDIERFWRKSRAIFMEDHIPISPDMSLLFGKHTSKWSSMKITLLLFLCKHLGFWEQNSFCLYERSYLRKYDRPTHYCPKYPCVSHILWKGNVILSVSLELQWRQEPPCSSWDTGRVALFLFSPGGKSLN